jgi:hypothetical protein
MNNLSWKNRLMLMKPNEKIGASLRWSDNEHNLIKKLNKFKKLGYLKSLGCIGSQIMYMRTHKLVNEIHFTKIKHLKKEEDGE